ncbi:MAG: winged helix-turn-helix domain-containing protein [Tabrizicola sp.]|jgi:DNA-binding transcriptional ArsR family regulator|nr:winged helix-turn-helix domain-containing protein [Tabrizicola sp.]
MTGSPNIARLAAPLADPARARMVMLLMDGRAWTVTELGQATGLTKASASEHAARLLDAGLLTAKRQGRHKYLRLASPAVAHLIETMMALAAPDQPQSLGPRDPALREARLCYNHLAGALGVQLYASLSTRGFLAHTPGGLGLTARGHAFCQSFGLTEADLAPARAPLCRDCLDWSERQSHLGGRLGRLLLARMESQDWLRRRDGSRALTVTPVGRAAIAQVFPPC